MNTQLCINRRTMLYCLLYALFTAVSFFILVTHKATSFGYLMFFILQTALSAPLLSKKLALLWFIPVVLLASNRFISANDMFFIPNCFAIILCYSLAALSSAGTLELKSSGFLFDALCGVFEPLAYTSLPFRWVGSSLHDADTAKLKKVLTGAAIAIPCVIILILILSSADTVFCKSVDYFLHSLPRPDFILVVRIALSAAAGLYLFCFAIYSRTAPAHETSIQLRGDSLVLNIILISLAAVYTVFIVIQFTYLFAGRVPEGMSYSSYARKGFFELVFLSVVNILLILLSTSMTGGKSHINIICCLYLCAVTAVLGVSAFYRMHLYSGASGLTRLRYSVFVFLGFEGLGLLITFYYVLTRRINIVGVYAALALCYYLALNIVPMDYIIAKNQIDRYFSGDSAGIDYTFTLSLDADTQLMRLYGIDEYSERLKDRFIFIPQQPENILEKNLSLHLSGIARAAAQY